MNYSVERIFEQEVRYIASFMGKYEVVDAQVMKIIEQYVSKKDLCKEMQSAVVMWWRIPSKYSQKYAFVDY